MVLTANFPHGKSELEDKNYKGITLRCKDVQDVEKDIAQLLLEVQIHKCSDYCLRTSLSSDEDKKQ